MAKRALLYALALLAVAPLTAQEPLNADINAKIRQEESQPLADHADAALAHRRYGPRLTGSPNLKAAGEWAVEADGERGA